MRSPLYSLSNSGRILVDRQVQVVFEFENEVGFCQRVPHKFKKSICHLYLTESKYIRWRRTNHIMRISVETTILYFKNFSLREEADVRNNVELKFVWKLLKLGSIHRHTES